LAAIGQLAPKPIIPLRAHLGQMAGMGGAPQADIATKPPIGCVGLESRRSDIGQ